MAAAAHDKKLPWLGGATYAMLAVLSLVFYLERTVFIDIAFHLFYVLKDGTFAIQNYRFGAIFTQAFPLLASKLHLPLAQVMMAYSLGFVLYYAGIFFLCLRLSRPHALLLLLYNVFMVAGTFYWIQSEFSQGVALCILWWAMVAHDERLEHMSAWRAGAWSLLLFFLVFFHPLLPLVFVFMGAFHVLHRDYSGHKKLIFSGLIAFVGMAAVKARFFKTTYDTDATRRLDHLYHPFDYLNAPVWRQFLALLIQHYYLLLPALLGVVYVYVRRGHWKKLLLVLTALGGYLMVVNLSYPEGAEAFYMENLYLPLSLFLLMPLVWDVLPSLSQRWATGVVVAILAVRVWHIGMHHAPYSTRLHWERQFLQTTAGDKLILPDATAPPDTLMMTWGTGYEFWLLSTVETGYTRSILIDDNPHQYGWARQDARLFLTKWGAFPYQDLPTRYFVFPDTVGRYEVR